MVFPVYAQEKAIVFGTVKDEQGLTVEYANVAVMGYAGGVATDQRGRFELSVPASTELTLAITFIGYEKQLFMVFLQAGQRKELQVVMKISAEEEIFSSISSHMILRSLISRSGTPTYNGSIQR